MKALDVDKLMDNGPAWAVAHLSPGDLGLVRQYIDLDEQMKFRCSAPGSLVHLKHLDDEDDENGPKPADDAAGCSKDRSESAPSKHPNPKRPRRPRRPSGQPKRAPRAHGSALRFDGLTCRRNRSCITVASPNSDRFKVYGHHPSCRLYHGRSVDDRAHSSPKI